MAAGSPAPDLFGALAWSDRVAPPTGDAVAGQRADASAHAAVEEVLDAAVEEVQESPAALTSAGLERPVARPRSVTPPTRAPVPAPPSFGALADALEPPAGVSPVLDEFEDLLGVFDDGRAPASPVIPTSPVVPTSPVIPASPVTAVPAPPPAVRAPVPAPVPAAMPGPRAAARSTPAPPRRPTPVIATAARAPAPGVGAMPRPRLADAAPPPLDFPAPGDPAVSAQLASLAEPSSAMLSRVAARVDDEPAPRRGMPVVWIGLTLMLGGALAYVLATQTDLLSGNVIERRNAEAQAEAEREAAVEQAKIDAKRVSYGTIEIDSEPKAARVFDMREGPMARFEHLPVDHEYMVLVTAPGHLSRVRLVKGSELAAPVIVDLDPLPAGAAVPPVAEERVPKLATPPSKVDATLELRSNTPGAQLGLLVGYTPGVKVIDVDVEQPHRYLLVLAGHQDAEVVVKGRHFEEGPSGALVFQETVKLTPRPPVDPDAEPADTDEDVVIDEAPAASPAAPVPASKPAAASKKKKKKKKKRRR